MGDLVLLNFKVAPDVAAWIREHEREIMDEMRGGGPKAGRNAGRKK